MSKPTIGFVGLGEMGAPMVHSLLRAGYKVIGFDVDRTRMLDLADTGMVGAGNADELVRRCDILATSLPSSDSWVEFMEETGLGALREGQIVIDFGTVVPTDARRVAELFLNKGVFVVDAPVSGGQAGAESARLYVFVGGDYETVQQCMPLLHAVAGDEHVTYCGPAGCGQVVKGVNQLMMGLVTAAYLEAISFGVNSGIPSTVIRQAIGDEGFLRADFHRIAEAVVHERGKEMGVKYRELPYFLRAASDFGFSLPITSVVREYCERGEIVVVDDHRPAPSYWHELTKEAMARVLGT